MVEDFKGRKPGSSVGSRAEELRTAHPVRAVLARILNVPTEERAFKKGEAGEVEVARRLQALSDEWNVIHSIPVGDGHTDIDHLVIGPSGVFTLNTKNHLGGRVWVKGDSFYVNGRYKPYVPAARPEGRRVTRTLKRSIGAPPIVIPVIVVLASSLDVRSQPEDVFVIGRKKIAPWLLRQPRRLRNEEVDKIFEFAIDPSSWKS